MGAVWERGECFEGPTVQVVVGGTRTQWAGRMGDGVAGEFVKESLSRTWYVPPTGREVAEEFELETRVWVDLKTDGEGGSCPQ